MIKSDYPFWFFVVVLLFVLYFFYHIFAPFLMIFLWAAILVTTAYPVYARLLIWTGNRATLASIIMVISLTLLIILPLAGGILVIAKQSTDAYRWVAHKMQSESFPTLESLLDHPLLDQVRTMLPEFLRDEEIGLKSGLLGLLRGVSRFLVDQSQNIFSSAARTMFDFLLLLLTTYYFFKNGRNILSDVRKLSPLDADREDRILAKFRDVVQATMIGNLVTSLAQGLLGGIGFLLVGLPSPVLWGAVMAFLALVPLVGAFLVWMPAAIYLLATGSYAKGVFLIIWGIVIFILSDNVLKPYIIKGKANIHPVLIFFSIFGGLSFFGVSGLILGPLITAIAFVCLEIYREEFRDQLPGTLKFGRPLPDPLVRVAQPPEEIPDDQS